MNKKNFIFSDISISPYKIYFFLIKNYRIFLAFCIIGTTVFYVIYLNTPKKYEAVSSLNIAKVIIDDKENSQLSRTSVLEPGYIFFLLSRSSLYSSAIVDNCRLKTINFAADSYQDIIKVSQNKFFPNIIDIRTYGYTQKDAVSCNTSIIDLIQSIDKRERSSLLALFENRSNYYEKILDKLRNRYSNSGSPYLVEGVEFSFARQQLERYQFSIASLSLVGVRQEGEIQENGPIAPRIFVYLLLGFCFGAISSVLYVCLKHIIKIRKIFS